MMGRLGFQITEPALEHVLRFRGEHEAKIGGDKVIALVKHRGVFEGNTADERVRLSGPGIGIGMDNAADHATVIPMRGFQFVFIGDWPRRVIVGYDGKSLLNIAQED